MTYIGPEPNPGQNREVDDISSSFNGSTTAFTLQVNSQNVSPGSANAIIVSVGGVIQNPGTDYTINSSTLTFTTAPASGLSFFGLVLGQSVDTAQPADGSISTLKIADQAVTLAKLPHGTGSNDGKFLRANNGADPTFETVSGTTINNTAATHIITGSGTANTLNANSDLIWNGSRLDIDTGGKEDALRIGNTAGTDTFILLGSIGTNADTHAVIKYDKDDNYLSLLVSGESHGSGGVYIEDGGKVRLPSGVKIGGTVDANLLDDYEEGTWTPTVSSGTVGQASTAIYTKVGQMVHLQFGLYQFSDSTSGTNIDIGGIPFTAQGQAVGTWAAQRVDTDGLGTFCTIYGGGTVIQLLLNTGDTTGNVMGTTATHSRLAQTLAYQFMSLTYRTAS